MVLFGVKPVKRLKYLFCPLFYMYLQFVLADKIGFMSTIELVFIRHCDLKDACEATQSLLG